MNTLTIIVAITIVSGIALVVVGTIGADIHRGQAGYDSFYYRHYVPATSPFSSVRALEQVRNLLIGERAWVPSGFGCAYLIEHQHDPKWKYHLGVVHEARSRWGFPCHDASWWSGGSIIADGEADVVPSVWQATEHREGGGGRVRWHRVAPVETPQG